MSGLVGLKTDWFYGRAGERWGPNRGEARHRCNRSLTLIASVIGAALFAYGIAADRFTPYTSQGLVQAYHVRIAPEVGGKVIEVGVDADQRVDAGAVLFRIAPDQYALAVHRAEAQLEAAGQSIGVSTAAVASAQAELAEAMAVRRNAREQTARTFELVKKGIYDATRQQQAQTALDASETAVAEFEAEVKKARQTLGPQAATNSEIREAMGALEEANLHLTRTTIVAPFEGGVTNLSIAVGQVLGKGEVAMTYIDVREAWIEAAFRENSLEFIKVGDPVEIVLDIHPGRVIAGKVAVLGYGVGKRSLDSRIGLPSPSSQSGWVRTPQTMSVRIEFNRQIRGLRAGSQASVMIYPGDNAVMNAIGRFRMWLVALLTYVH